MSALTFDAQIEHLSPSELRPYARNARTHSKSQIRQIADSIKRFGFINPILISDDQEILAGHGRVRAAKLLDLKTVPALRVSHLTEAERRAYIIADNQLALNAGWDQDTLAIEFQAMIDSGFDVEMTGFSLAEVDLVLDSAAERDPQGPSPEDTIPVPPKHPVTRSGDIWILGRHRLLCGDAQQLGDFDRLMAGDHVDLIFTDPPYNVAIDGNVCGKGAVRHREFPFASGEMSKDVFTQFLAQTLCNMAAQCRDGAIAFVCMDWRHVGELLDAGDRAFTQLKNICVWAKTNAGLGSFYRSQHELVFVWKVGTAPHTNSFGLGATGRYRTNVWTYAGVNSFGASRSEELAMHPTVKPVALVADAIRDCTRRGDIVLDGFGGSGSTLMAAESCGRTARLIEFEPHYCDVIVARFEKLTGKHAVLESDGSTFEDVDIARRAPAFSAEIPQ